MPERGEQHGFTFAEVAVTTALVAVVLIPILGTVIMASRVQNEASHQLQALNIARAELEILEEQGYNAVPPSSTFTYPNSTAAADWPLSGYQISITSTLRAGQALKDITLTVNWTDKVGSPGDPNFTLDKSITLATSIASRP